MAKSSIRTVLFIGTEPIATVVESFNTVATRMSLPWKGVSTDLTVPLEQLQSAGRIVAIQEGAHRHMLEARFTDWIERIEFWDLDVSPNVAGEVTSLVSRLFTGQRRTGPPVPPPPPKVVSKGTVKVGRETKGRRGKGVTLISEVPLKETALQELATLLKNKCGTGGTVKDGVIEIQGDQRDRITTELEKMGYKVKRVGG